MRVTLKNNWKLFFKKVFVINYIKENTDPKKSMKSNPTDGRTKLRDCNRDGIFFSPR